MPRIFAAPVLLAFAGMTALCMASPVDAAPPSHTREASSARKHHPDARAHKVVVRIPIRYSVVIHHTLNMRTGVRKIIQHGRNGLAERVYRVYSDGVRKETALHILKHSRPEILREGVNRRLPSRGYFSGRRVLWLMATKYRANGRRTASGLRSRFGVVAVDPRVIPLGTRLYIDGYGYAVAGDTGGAIKGDRIDLCISAAHPCRNLSDRGMVCVHILN